MHNDNLRVVGVGGTLSEGYSERLDRLAVLVVRLADGLETEDSRSRESAGAGA